MKKRIEQGDAPIVLSNRSRDRVSKVYESKQKKESYQLEKSSSHKKIVASLPNFTSHNTKEMEERLGKFIYMPPEQGEPKNVVKRDPVELTNGAYYHGEWN